MRLPGFAITPKNNKVKIEALKQKLNDKKNMVVKQLNAQFISLPSAAKAKNLITTMENLEKILCQRKNLGKELEQEEMLFESKLPKWINCQEVYGRLECPKITEIKWGDHEPERGSQQSL